MGEQNAQHRGLKRSWITVDHMDDSEGHASVTRDEKFPRLGHNYCDDQELLPGMIDSGFCANMSFDPLQEYIGGVTQSSAQLQLQPSWDWSAVHNATPFQLQQEHTYLSDGGMRALGHLSQSPAGVSTAPFAASDLQDNKPNSTGHSYGNIEASGQANVQNGDQHNYYGPEAQMQGTSYVLGNMIVNYAHHVVPRQLHSPVANDADLELKKALYYEGLDARRAQLDIVDPASLEWIWSRTSFPQWLEGEGTLYRISGKPASGKSTLINHLIGRDRERVMEFLKRRHTSPLLVHFFFDFRSGSGVANSLVGFMRSFLLQLIDSSEHVKRYCRQHCSYRLPGDWPNDAKQLSTIMIDALKGEERLICGMVDGLDEYQGDLRDLFEALQRLQRSLQIKLCLSSRPDTRIAQQFGGASFEMQDHNSETISAYIDAAFSSLQSSKVYICEHDLERLKREMRNRANGVVLWVKFAVGEVLDAFHNGDDLAYAIDRLQTLSADLTDVYARILGRLNTEQRMEAAVLLFVIKSWPRTAMIELRLESLLTFYGVVMKKVYARRTGFSNEKDISRFRLKLHSILGGLIDLVNTEEYKTWSIMGTSVVRLTHATLNTFLERDETSQVYNREIGRVFKPDCFVTQILADVVAMVSHAVDQNAVDRSIMNTRGGGENLWVLSRLAQESPRAPEIHLHPDLIYRAWCLIERSDLEGIKNCKSCANNLLRIAQSWVIQSFIRNVEDVYKTELRGLSQNVWDLWDDHLELFELILWKQEFVLEVLLEQDLKGLPDEIKDELRQCLVDRKKYEEEEEEEEEGDYEDEDSAKQKK